MSRNETTFGSFCWSELATRDVGTAQSFQAKLFGWQSRDREMPGSGPPCKMMRLGTEDLAGMYDLAGPHFEGVGRFALLSDPTGAMFAVIKLELKHG